MHFKLGADPEVFVQDLTSQTVVSAHNLVPGTKKQPYPVPCGAVQVDGMALEFNIEPATNSDQFVTNLMTVMTQLEGMLPTNMAFANITSHYFPSAYMETQPRDALELGCEPDYNAYTGTTNPPPNDTTTLRTAAGHVHLGFDIANPGTHFEDCCMIVKQLDYFLALPSMWVDDAERRRLYGKAGAFRPKSYGLEYRVLGNWWIAKPLYMSWIWDQTANAINYLADGIYLPDEFGPAEDIINNNDKSAALNLMNKRLHAYEIYPLSAGLRLNEVPDAEPDPDWYPEEEPEDDGGW